MVSIIIPVYNAEKTLKKCLDSILNQTYTKYEVILINDGSKDNSLEIMQEYKGKHPDIFQIHDQENVGPAVTRNRGMEHAKGEYLFFIDCDDYIDEKYIETFVKEIEEKEVDMVIGGYRRVRSDGALIFKRDAIDNPWTKYMMVAPWARVYRAESLKRNGLKFLESNIWEDVYFNILANLKLKVSTTDYNGYYWVYNTSSFSNTTQKKLNPSIDLIKVFDKIKEDAGKTGVSKEEEEYFEYFFVKACVWYLIHSGKGVEYSTLKKEYEKLFTWLVENFPQYMKNEQIGILKPKGEGLSARVAVFLFLFLKRIKMERIFLRVLSF